MLRFLRSYWHDRRGNIAILSTVMITSLVGVSGLAVEFGNGLLNRMQDQRIADAAAMSGGTIYNSTSSTTAMQAAVTNIATLNGVSTTAVSSSVVSSPSGDGNEAVMVTVRTTVPLALARVLWTASPGASMPVSATSYAELKSGLPGCIIALSSSGTGVTLSGGTGVTAAGCAVASNTTASVPCGTSIVTKALEYDTSYSECTTPNSITAPSGSTLTITKTLTSDPLSGATGVADSTSHLSSVSSISSPASPTVTGGTAVSFGYTASTTQTQLTADGCSGTFTSNIWTVTCSNGTYNFGAISLSGGITVNFNLAGAASNTYNFNGQICDSGTALHFGNGIYNVSGGIASGGGSSTTFGYGTFNIGRVSTGSNPCGAPTGYSIYNTGSVMTFGSATTASTFTIVGGINNSGGETLVMGGACTNGGNPCTGTSSSNSFTSPTGNSFNLGATTAGDSIVMGGGAATYFGDATGSGKLFQTAGNVNVTSGGGSCLWIGAAAEHDINGYMSTAGGTTLGSGRYSIYKYLWLGGGGGGDVTCGGSTVGMYGNNVTMVIGGNGVPTSGGCPNDSFCVSNGYGHVTLSSPGSGSLEGLAVIGPISSGNTNGALFTGGASNTTLSGAVYFPHGPVSLSGAGSLGNGTGQCLELIGSQVTLSGGSAVGTTCTISGQTGGTNGAVALVQ
ncbi:MAG TPA: pilus assembly protein TadG-related protein [Rhizomicrobium sp.]